MIEYIFSFYLKKFMHIIKQSKIKKVVSEKIIFYK